MTPRRFFPRVAGSDDPLDDLALRSEHSELRDAAQLDVAFDARLVDASAPAVRRPRLGAVRRLFPAAEAA